MNKYQLFITCKYLTATLEYDTVEELRAAIEPAMNNIVLSLSESGIMQDKPLLAILSNVSDKVKSLIGRHQTAQYVELGTTVELYDNVWLSVFFKIPNHRHFTDLSVYDLKGHVSKVGYTTYRIVEDKVIPVDSYEVDVATKIALCDKDREGSTDEYPVVERKRDYGKLSAMHKRSGDKIILRNDVFIGDIVKYLNVDDVGTLQEAAELYFNNYEETLPLATFRVSKEGNDVGLVLIFNESVLTYNHLVCVLMDADSVAGGFYSKYLNQPHVQQNIKQMCKMWQFGFASAHISTDIKLELKLEYN